MGGRVIQPAPVQRILHLRNACRRLGNDECSPTFLVEITTQDSSRLSQEGSGLIHPQRCAPMPLGGGRAANAQNPASWTKGGIQPSIRGAGSAHAFALVLGRIWSRAVAVLNSNQTNLSYAASYDMRPGTSAPSQA